MLISRRGKAYSGSLMQDYAALLGDAVLRSRARTAEHRAKLEGELAARVKSEFISNMSHELRTPLNTVMGFSKILASHGSRQLSDPDIVQYATLIHDAASHLLAVINDILDISRMTSGNYSVETREVDLAEILRKCTSDYRKPAEEAGLELTTRIAFDLPTVRGDEKKLSQIFSNILSNAVKFTERGGSVVLDASEHADGRVMIAIRDTGIGMTDDEIHVALEPFGQVDGGRARWREGTGLGLPIAKALIELHGGEFMISSERGRGTEITVMLPSAGAMTLAEARDAVFGHGPSA